MTNEHVTTKIWKKTIKKLRMLHALTGESMLAILDRVLTAELERTQKEQNGTPESL
jgi:hypothetical protein